MILRKSFLKTVTTLKILLILSLLGISSCAYFNTFYNAREYYDLAEEKRLEKVGETVPRAALDAYLKVIEKSQRVLDKYPNSRYRYEAILLMGISRYHRGEVRKAESLFRTLEQENPEDYSAEARFWQAMCKWKLGKIQAALNKLGLLQSEVADSNFKARIYLAKADIYLNEKLNSKAFSNLEQAAELTRDSNERSQIYYQIASLAFNNQDYKLAFRANRQVIKNTLSKARLSDAQLNIIKIYRQQGDYKSVVSKVEDLLVDDQYKNIHTALELELGNSLYDQGDLPGTITQMEKIIADYPKTSEAAEAYFIIGKIQLNYRHNLDSAKIIFEKSVKENRKSAVYLQGQEISKNINAYLAELEKIEKNTVLLSVSEENSADSVAIDSSIGFNKAAIDSQRIFNNIAESLYKLAEYELFHFNYADSGKKLLNDIIEFYPGTDYHPKALFTLNRFALLNNESDRAKMLADSILSQYPESEYADFIRKDDKRDLLPSDSELLLRQAEVAWMSDKYLAMQYTKSILASDTTSENSAKAAYFLAYHYDFTFNIADSALAYYQLLSKYHPESEQNAAAISRSRQIERSLAPAEELPITNPVIQDSIVNDD